MNIISCIFKENKATVGYGDALYANSYNNITIFFTYFLSNFATRGGGIELEEYNINIINNCTFKSNLVILTKAGGGTFNKIFIFIKYNLIY